MTMPFRFLGILQELAGFSVRKSNRREPRMIRILKIPINHGSIRVDLSQICVIYAKVVAAFAKAGGSFLRSSVAFTNPDSLVFYFSLLAGRRCTSARLF